MGFADGHLTIALAKNLVELLTSKPIDTHQVCFSRACEEQ